MISPTAIGMLIFTAGLFVVAVVAVVKKQAVRVEQPLTVEIVKALHEQFANKEEFLKLVAANTERHAQIFKSIERVEKEARLDLGAAVAGINADRARTVEKLNEQFTFIRETLSAINTELRLTREEP